MRNKRFVSLIMTFIMLASMLQFNIFASSENEKEKRMVYLHAFKDEPLLTDTTDRTTVYMGDTVNVSLAIDKPNKAESDLEPQFNLGGFTVKIYFDTRFFDFVPPYKNDETKSKDTAIEYYFVADNGWADDNIEDGTGNEVFDKPGFVKYSQGTHTKDGVSSTQGYAYATIFYSGKSLPYSAANKDYWYDIARLPLIPKQTGNTRVQLDISGDDEYTLELFAKDNPNLDEIKRSFDYDAVNSGVFNITIADKSKPNPPLATPVGSTYTSAQNVRLSIENPDDLPAKIYYTTDGSEPSEDSDEYTPEIDSAGGIIIDKTTVLKCITLREKDGRTSNTATYQYTIVPGAPILFNEHKEQISNSYTENWAYTESWDEDGYKVFATDKDDINQNITDGSTIYYTFSELSPEVINDNPDNIYVGTNPDTQWVKVSNSTKELSRPITKFRTVRLVNFYKDEKSSVSTYYLGIKPGAVFAEPSPDSAANAPVKVKLTCYAPPEAKIYYTINGKNPRYYGSLYEDEITVTSNTTIKAIAFYENIWGEVCEFDYVFDNNPVENITAFNPPGNYEGIVGVALMPKEPGNTIYYSLNGSQYIKYTSSLYLDKDTVVTAYIEGAEDSVYTFEYKIKPKAPVFSPEQTQLTHAEWITIFTPDCTLGTKKDFELKFTVDGSTPTKDTINPSGVKYTYNSETHEARIYITEKTTVKAVVVKYGEYVSNVSSHKYEIVTDRPASPVLVLPEGDYTNSEDADLSTVFKDIDGVEIYYTYATDGKPIPDPDPNSESDRYTPDSAVILETDKETVIKAIAVKKSADGNLIISDMAVLRYRVSGEKQIVSSGEVYADKPSGTYIETKDGHTVTLAGSDDIWYNKDGEGWEKYTRPINFDYSKADATLYIRNGENGESIPYTYHFEPPAPVINPTSGVYKGNVTASFDFPEGTQYRCYIQQSGGYETLWQNGDFEQKFTDTVSIEAYVVNNVTGIMSKHVYRDYIITDGDYLGELSINWPYNASKISKHLLGTDDYVKGITFGGTYGNNNVIYQVKYTPNGGIETSYSPEHTYDDKLPVIPTKQMENITIKAWIEGKKDDYLEHTIHFIDLGIPTVTTDKNKNSSGNYPKATNAYVLNEYASEPDMIVFYTLNGQYPGDSASKRYSFTGEKSEAIVLSNTTAIKAVYYSTCGKCENCEEESYDKCMSGIYGDLYNGIFPVVEASVIGGSAASASASAGSSRKYTKDIFGSEHPTHIGYINGYPDGSVRPEGDITREEVTSILYRITNHEYENPFVATGKVFPDVILGRWSTHDIEYMADKNVVYGYPDGEFKPLRNLSRSEFAALIFRFTGIEKANIKNPFKDLDNNHWAYDEILALANTGLIEGYPDKTYGPENNITRAEVMTVINKLLGRKPLESYVKSLNFNPYNDLNAEKWYYVTVLEATITHNYYLDTKGYEYKWEDWK